MMNQNILRLDFVRNEFSKDPHFLGSYSYLATGITKDDRIALRYPINQSLWFAGEYTNGWNFGYAHGAYVTGQTSTNAILKCMRGECLPERQRQPWERNVKKKRTAHIRMLHRFTRSCF